MTLSRRARGFSLVELLITVAVLSVLVAAAVPVMNGYLLQAQRTKAREDIDLIIDGIRRYQKARNELLTGNRLEPLLGVTMTALPKDPWGNEYFFDGKLGLVGSYVSREMGVEARPVVVQYSKRLAPLKATLRGGGFGLVAPGLILELQMSKSIVVLAGREDLIPYDLMVIPSTSARIPVPLATYGFAYQASGSSPEYGRIVLEIGSVPPGAPVLPAESVVALAGFCGGLREVIASELVGYSLDPLDFVWGMESPLRSDGEWTGAKIQR